jgi:type II secretory pathway component PulJ
MTAEIKKRNRQKRGTIIRETRDGRCWIILWDGNKTGCSGTHKSYIATLTRWDRFKAWVKKILT